MPDTQYRRISVCRTGYAVVPGNTDDEAIENATGLGASDFDWEPVDAAMIRAEAEVVETVNEHGEPLPQEEGTRS